MCRYFIYDKSTERANRRIFRNSMYCIQHSVYLCYCDNFSVLCLRYLCLMTVSLRSSRLYSLKFRKIILRIIHCSSRCNHFGTTKSHIHRKIGVSVCSHMHTSGWDREIQRVYQIILVFKCEFAWVQS